MKDLQKQLIEGSLLGDGSLTKIVKHDRKNSAYKEAHCFKQRGYLESKYNLLQDLNPTIRIERNCYRMVTKSFPFLTELEFNWYVRDPDGEYVYNEYGKRIKKLPQNLKLTPLMVAAWFLDDGYNDPNSNSKNYFSNINFTKQEKEHLCILLDNLRISTYLVKRRDSQVIRVAAKSCNYLRNLIAHEGEAILSNDIRYKIKVNREILPITKLSKKDVYDIVDMHKNGVSNREISAFKNISSTTISNILHGDTWKSLPIQRLKINSNNKSGVKGVYYDAERNKWAVQVNHKFYGRFVDFAEAAEKRRSLA